MPTGDQICSYCNLWAVLCTCKPLKGETMKHDEAEQKNTASQEIEVARRELAKQVNEQLETHRGIKDLVILATALEKIR